MVALDIEAATGGTRGQDRAGQPGGVAETSDDATVFGMSGLNDPDGPGGGGDGNTETHEESTTHHLSLGGVGGGQAHDNGAENNADAANEHADATSPLINSRSDKRQSRDTANLEHGADQTSPDALVLAVEVLEEVFLVAEQAAEHTGVETVHGLAEETDQKHSEELQSPGVEQRHGFLDQSLVVGFVALDFLDLDDL